LIFNLENKKRRRLVCLRRSTIHAYLASAQTKTTVVMMVMTMGVELGEVHGGHFSGLKEICQKKNR
jgi:hypothetical protein